MKKIIIHIDDIGVSKSANKASFDLLNSWFATSGSIMIPCKWFEDAIENYKKNIALDLWVHLTLTSERDNESMKWRPTLPISEVPSLVDKNGYFHSTLDEVFENANYEDIKKELCSQLEISLKAWLKPSHYDSHMGVLLHKKLFNIYLEIATLFKIQPFISQPKEWDSLGNRFYDCDIYIDKLKQIGFSVLDHYDANSLYNWNDFNEYSKNRLKQIQDGTTYFLIHVLGEQIDYEDLCSDYISRQKEYDFFKSNEVKDILNQKDIQLISVKQL